MQSITNYLISYGKVLGGEPGKDGEGTGYEGEHFACGIGDIASEYGEICE